ncbi:MAG: hypothetical protein SGILL_002809 [Bacillariaceae sp.]
MMLMRPTMRPLCALLLAARLLGVAPFSNSAVTSTMARSSQLFGISEWRDEAACSAGGDDMMKREVPLHLMPSSEVAIPGETKYFQFQTESELRLFQQAMDRHHGIFGLGLMVTKEEDHFEPIDGQLKEEDVDEEEQATMVQKIALMEIVDYKNMNLRVDLGVFVEAQVVGRATSLAVEEYESKQEKNGSCGTLMAECIECLDEPETHFTLEQVNSMAEDMVELIAKISHEEESSLECSVEEEDCDTRRDRFQKAVRDVYVTDSHGYTMPSMSKPGLRSWKELSAISWAAFSSSSSYQWEETHRLYALDMPRIATRIQLASFWLSDLLVQAEQAARNAESQD